MTWKRGNNNSQTTRLRLVVHLFVLTTFSRGIHVFSEHIRTHCQMESIILDTLLAQYHFDQEPKIQLVWF